jgi:hypothetical protein
MPAGMPMVGAAQQGMAPQQPGVSPMMFPDASQMGGVFGF